MQLLQPLCLAPDGITADAGIVAAGLDKATYTVKVQGPKDLTATPVDAKVQYLGSDSGRLKLTLDLANNMENGSTVYVSVTGATYVNDIIDVAQVMKVN